MSLPFYLPFDDFLSHPALNKQTLSSRIVVVAHIGKENLFNSDDFPTTAQSVFGPKALLPAHLDDPNSMCRIECRYVYGENTLHLYLSGPWSLKNQSPLFHRFVKQMNEVGFLECWNASTNNHARALLFIFALSHVVVIHHPSETPDYATLQILKLLSYIRPKQQTLWINLLKSNQLSDEEWLRQGRLCSPRLLFVFKCPNGIRSEQSDVEKIARIRKLERSLEDSIYNALRKAKTVKYACNRAFYSIAPNDEFVHVENPRVDKEPVNDLFRKLNLGAVLHSEPVQNHQREDDSDSADDDDDKYLYDYSTTLRGHTFERFLQVHTTKAHEEGFLDNMGKYTHVKPYFHKPTLEVWLEAAKIILHDPLIGLTNETHAFGDHAGTKHTVESTERPAYSPVPKLNVTSLPTIYPIKPTHRLARHHKGPPKPSRQDRREEKKKLQIHRRKRESPERVWNPFTK
ncbi:Hypothetical protein NTJ_03394 [Nesidiocoris tenuis]|uniref:Nonsense-mediated mRNA decay factor SMG8 n=1 Tax=Nesidiocoris tenuis TaxID=355587 RepID=A0ABN7AI74_9HEMI|nr:Hypothetical protein NTJ_03394 [Nesidiocoris tenuis]